MKKEDSYLAILTNLNTQWELGHYYDQGYAFVMEVSAFGANTAVEIAKQSEKYEIVKLQAELNSLRQEYQKVIEENRNLKFNGQYTSQTRNNDMNPLEVLGFTIMPEQEKLKRRYKELSQKYHPDKGGSHLIMKLIQAAYVQLKNDQ